jgi:membrane-bound lytic murein transglycosylase MltF
MFAVEDPKIDALLPVDDSAWAENVSAGRPGLALELLLTDIQSLSWCLPRTLDTSTDVTMGQFARECQISYLLSRVLRHTLDPSADATFHESEEVQLERTLKAFMPLLMEEDSKYGQYCAAFAICVW